MKYVYTVSVNDLDEMFGGNTAPGTHSTHMCFAGQAVVTHFISFMKLPFFCGIKVSQDQDPYKFHMEQCLDSFHHHSQTRQISFLKEAHSPIWFNFHSV